MGKAPHWQDWGRRQWIPWGSTWDWVIEGIWFYVYLLAGRLSGRRCYGFWFKARGFAFWRTYYPMRLWRKRR